MQQSVQLNCYHGGMPLRCSQKWKDNCQCKKVFYEKDAVALVVWKVVRVACNFRWSSCCRMLATACNWRVQNSTLCQAVATNRCYWQKKGKKGSRCSFIYQNIPIFKDKFLHLFDLSYSQFHRLKETDINNNSNSTLPVWASESTLVSVKLLFG